jgi:hypothetical protein
MRDGFPASRKPYILFIPFHFPVPDMPTKKTVAAKRAPAKRSPVARKAAAKRAPVRRAAAKKAPAAAPAAPPAAAKPPKTKLVRDSFTIPKAEYAVIDSLKQRANQLAHSVKKSELLRAGIKALAAMSDADFLAAVKGVPAIKTGRPKEKKADDGGAAA